MTRSWRGSAVNQLAFAPPLTRFSVFVAALLNGVDIRQIQEYLGYASVETAMIYTHVVKELRTPALADAYGDGAFDNYDDLPQPRRQRGDRPESRPTHARVQPPR